MTVPQCLSRRILLSPVSSTPRPHHNYITTTTKKSAVPISNWSQFHQFQTLPLLFFTSSPKPISIIPPFLVCRSGSRPVSHAGVSTTSVHVGYHEGKETTDASNLKEKVEGLGINCDSCTPGRYTLLTCPKCRGGQSMERGLSFHMSKYGDFAMWRCFHVDCGWAGQVFAENSAAKLVPLGEKIIAYFAERKISNDILLRNAVMQLSGDQNTMAFTYRRNGVIVSCKYRSLDRRFWQEKTTEKILYGLDDIKEADEIIIVEGEIDKLSMEEAGFINCVSVPDGAPQKVSAELPPLEKDSRFRYLWNCKEYLDKASRIILATDGDMPGDVLAEEIARRLGRERCWRVCWPKKDEFSYCKDANEVLMNLGTDALRDVVDNAVLYPNHNLLEVK